MRRISILFASFLLLSQIFILSSVSAAENCGLTPPLRAESASFRQLSGTFCIALAIYKLDAVDHTPKDVIMRDHGAALINDDIRFDLEKMDTGKKGWTRYYPVEVGGKPFIVRVFLTKELSYQPRLPVIYEMQISDPEVTCQVLPPINDMIAPQRIEPFRIPARSMADLSA